jgi:hypothetical protein
MSLETIRQRADRLRAIPLESVLRLRGVRPDPLDRFKWHTSVGILSVNGAKFINWNHGTGGGGAIDLVIHLNHCSFREALDWLQRHYPRASGFEGNHCPNQSGLNLPQPDPVQLGRVKAYLITERAIAPAPIDLLIKSGVLYADARANALFLLLGKNTVAVGAELRGTTSVHWRGMAPGSRKNLGYFSIPTQITGKDRRSVILCESAIDAISCFAIHPDHRCISTSGARPNPSWLPDLIIQGFPIYCGFDADDTGERMAQSMIALHPSIKRLRPARHDWNDRLKSQA